MLKILQARVDQRVAIANLMQLYIHDFSVHWSGTQNGELQDDGRFADYPLDPYWTKPDHIPLLIQFDQRPIGFALLNASAHSGLGVERNMAEFFIVRKHRRAGLGLAAAHQIFDCYPGRWEAAVARRNVDALAFWRKAAAQHPRASSVEELDVATKEWNGPILRFLIG